MAVLDQLRVQMHALGEALANVQRFVAVEQMGDVAAVDVCAFGLGDEGLGVS